MLCTTLWVFSSEIWRVSGVDREPGESMVLRLARTHGLSVYDASYLEQALREAMPFATLNTQLTAAARAEGSRLI